MMCLFTVDADIRRAWTPPGWVYTDSELYAHIKHQIFARTWQLVADTDSVKTPGQVYPFMLLEGCVDEPLLLTRDMNDQIHCLSNACTHRGNLVCETPGNERYLRCRYHGRRFGLDGKFQQMPEFEEAQDFPTERDDLPRVPFALWEKLIFVSLEPACAFEDYIRPVVERVGWMPIREFVFDPARSRDYLVRANWALYCDNYLEGFHIPFVHASLNQALDYGSYRTELFEYGNLQVGIARGGEDCFELPPDSPDYGQNIAAYYFWLFPNLMLNFYPWGLSINIVKPLGVDLTRVSFLSYVWDYSKIGVGAGAELDKVEREDEAIVEATQRGVRSRLYERGRYSPTREQGVHHFHRLLERFLNGA
ncbi:MAG: choline monooxygenase [Fimbriimonadales bacterium]|nr:MAG: choline monooxygenase [Fimbriimonadales bacterium]GIV09352.1 MAG: choline monooxygenase [Fimbriimonadales bacterium]